MLKFYIALVTSKIVYSIMKLLKRKASYFPGYIAIKICPNYLELIKKPDKLICVSGTDGKTTTANLIADVLNNCNYKVISNRDGSNTNIGVATALTKCVNIIGHIKVDAVVLEVDEHWTRNVFPQIKPNYLIVTNIIRDSLKRNAHPEYVFNKINKCGVKGMKVILNADELCSSELLKDNERIYFGIDKMKTDLKKSKNRINDYKYCPICGNELVYDYVRYCHIGSCHCSKCEFKSKNADYKVNKIDYKKNTLTVNSKYNFPIINDGLFNIYNEIAIIALFMDMGFSEDKLKDALESVQIIKTRFTENKIGNIRIIKLMAKSNNSIPVSLVFDYIKNKKENKVVLLALDDYDEAKASEYIGWIYDTDYEFLNDKYTKQIIITGPRCYDHKLRVLLTGYDEKNIVCNPNELEALEKIKKKSIESIYILHDMSSYELSVKAENKILEILGGKHEN